MFRVRIIGGEGPGVKREEERRFSGAKLFPAETVATSEVARFIEQRWEHRDEVAALRPQAARV